MKAIMVMFDSLNRRFLPAYGCDWIHAPNFQRLAEASLTFDNSYVASMPCMPARRELHTGRYNFLHRDWGPLEPFDDSMPQLLKEALEYNEFLDEHLCSRYIDYTFETKQKTSVKPDIRQRPKRNHWKFYANRWITSSKLP